MDRLQDLPHDIALQCFIRAWKAEVHLPELLRLRNSTEKAQSLVILSQEKVNPSEKRKCPDVPVYRFIMSFFLNFDVSIHNVIMLFF
ncbi:hypothetical protein Hanom_Chr03g00178931 [Helianthus anomalus]